MKRLIHCADLHLTPFRPLCRKDSDWIATQRGILRTIVRIADQKDAEISVGGDVFDGAHTSPEILNMLLEEFGSYRKPVHMIGGNHSLLYHNDDNVNVSSIGAVKHAKTSIIYYDSQDFNTSGPYEHGIILTADIRMVHVLTFPPGMEPPYGSKAVTPQYLLDKYPEKYILLGDYHQAFIYSKDGRYVINPGCTLIHSADLIDYRPRVFYIDLEKEIVETIFLPHDPEQVTDNHLEEKRARDEKYAAFIQTIKKQGKLSLSFEANLDKAMEQENLPQDIADIIEEIQREVHSGLARA